MNKHRLLKLADLLEADARNKEGIRFNMLAWGYVGDHNKPLSCGTEACAMGLAALSGAFKHAGLGMKIQFGKVTILWHGQSIGGFEAAQQLFEIGNYEAYILFGGTGHGSRTELAKAKQIRTFVATGKL